MYKNKYCLITGGAGLLGPEHASSLAEIGFNIILIDIRQKELQKKKYLLKKKFPDKDILHFVCDITKENSVLSLHKKLKKKNIFVSVLINNADVNPKMSKNNSKTGLIENYKSATLRKEVEVGIIGTFNCCKIFGSLMVKKGGGVIINISSDLGINAPDHRVYHANEDIKKVKNFKPIGYSISKHALSGITKYLATYWAHKNVRCNSLVPGAVLNTQSKFLVKNIKKRVPMNRLANKDEYKKAIQFLATDASKYMTGQNLMMDGGRTIW
jgi:NAD(P)-dependent dehydrogenase (short-subunit alcohol dehydrogenase family)